MWNKIKNFTETISSIVSKIDAVLDFGDGYIKINYGVLFKEEKEEGKDA